MFDEIGSSIAYSILDLKNFTPISRIRSTEFKSADRLREWLRTKLNLGTRPRLSIKRNVSRPEFKNRSKTIIATDIRKD